MPEITELRSVLMDVQKPGRYTGGEPGCVYKEKEKVDLRFAFCFPDTYEVGMSFLGMKILYEILNQKPNVWCERVFMPWLDMKEAMETHNIPLYALESKDPLSEFDVIGFTLQYELSYTNILAMLDLAHIPAVAQQRAEADPFIVAGGPCACNPEPLADFFDLFMLGEGEVQLPMVCDTILQGRKEGLSKHEILVRLSRIEGVYVPSLYDVSYFPDGRIEKVTAKEGAPAVVRKAIIQDMNSQPLPTHFVVPMIGAVHDRAQIEVLRGCVRGCRFCQAGFLYRPMRERNADMLSEAGRELCDNTGYDEISLTSLSTSDHSQLEPLLDDMLSWTQSEHVSMSLPSLRIDNFSQSLVEKTTRVRKSGLTFAPEAGTQRLRDVINKNVTWEEIERSCTLAFNAGYTAVKLYFMMGLPTETMEDIAGIAETAQKIVDLYYSQEHPKGKGVQVSISVACFVPKPHTPFQFVPQDTQETLREKQQYLLRCVRSRKISVSYHDSRTSFLEAVFAKGDRRLGKVLLEAYHRGCYFDGWDDHFLYDTWLEVFRDLKADPAFYANRAIALDEVTPWEHLDYAVTKNYLIREYQKALEGKTTQPCNRSCAGCGANSLLGGGACFDYNSSVVHKNR
ncbi:TIGR03960 family B12-binding radical SAM protein [Ruthenibacterium sp. CLA-JM-H11]|uniref:TIGR03960 family B12-binding radical SAM protein n=1 Tax=Ruthenibacterium intestinale TaxID=3133163 RepID=A0ABV1GIN2_9FIRM